MPLLRTACVSRQHPRYTHLDPPKTTAVLSFLRVLPHSLTSGTSQDHVGVFARGSDGGDGTTVTDTSTLVDDLLGHFEERLC
jgi:hypothetical protein